MLADPQNSNVWLTFYIGGSANIVRRRFRTYTDIISIFKVAFSPHCVHLLNFVSVEGSTTTLYVDHSDMVLIEINYLFCVPAICLPFALSPVDSPIS